MCKQIPGCLEIASGQCMHHSTTVAVPGECIHHSTTVAAPGRCIHHSTTAAAFTTHAGYPNFSELFINFHNKFKIFFHFNPLASGTLLAFTSIYMALFYNFNGLFSVYKRLFFTMVILTFQLRHLIFFSCNCCSIYVNLHCIN